MKNTFHGEDKVMQLIASFSFQKSDRDREKESAMEEDEATKIKKTKSILEHTYTTWSSSILV